MKPAKELYAGEIDGDYFSVYSYQPIINAIGDVVLQVDDSDYQGDTRVLYKKGRKYGYLIFGWGSCSGCDALQAYGSFEEVDELAERLGNSVAWFDSLKALQQHFKDKDWELDYSWHVDETKEFIEKVLAL